MAEVTLEQVSKTFRTKRARIDAVVDLNLAVADGEFLVLVGPSGCGKTTILRLIAGLEELTSGTIRIGEGVVNHVAPKDRDIAMVFQNYALYPHMTVFKNMAFGLKMRRVPKEEIRRKVEEVAGLLGIESLLESKPGSLSGGEQQRVALGRAIVRKPKVFLFDEPLSNLDARLRVQTRTEIKSLHRELRTTIVYVTHDQEEAMTLGDRIVVLDRGMEQQCGAPLDVYNKPANRFVAGFLGNPSMNFLEGRLQRRDDTLTLVSGEARFALPKTFAEGLRPHGDDTIVLGIRPEHLILDADGTPRAAPRSYGTGFQPVRHRQDAGAAPGEPSSSREARVSLGPMSIHLVEPLGDATNVYLMGPGGITLAARLGPTIAFATEQQVNVFVDASRIHVFASGDCGERLS